MPFYNLGYTGNRLLPIATNDADFSFRVWINNGTSIERIISVSKSKEFGEEAYLDEISVSSKKNTPVKFYSKQKLSISSGIDKFTQEIDSLNLYGFQNQRDEDFQIATDTPFSLYIVEVKNKGNYHCFKFKTNYPLKSDTTSKYNKIQNLVFKEFKYKFYFNKN